MRTAAMGRMVLGLSNSYEQSLEAQGIEIQKLQAQLAERDKEIASLKLHARTSQLRRELQDAGWAVVGHHDYRQDGDSHTFWGLSKGNEYAHGEGLTDLAALRRVQNDIMDR